MEHTLLHVAGGGQEGGYTVGTCRTTTSGPLPGPPAEGLLDAARGPLHPVAADTLAAALRRRVGGPHAAAPGGPPRPSAPRHRP